MAADTQTPLISAPIAGRDAAPRCRWLRAGRLAYADGLRLQDEARDAVLSGVWQGVLITLEHEPIVTLGRGGGSENIRHAIIARDGVPMVDAGRGGNVTCHNPGQLVVYPVLDLGAWKKDVVWYVRSLEEVVIRTLATYGLHAGRKPRYTGVWLGDEKIAAIGVSVRRWVTGHGLALNVDNDLALFEAIVPCGIREFGVTNMVRAGVRADLAAVRARLADAFVSVFACALLDR